MHLPCCHLQYCHTPTRHPRAVCLHTETKLNPTAPLGHVNITSNVERRRQTPQQPLRFVERYRGSIAYLLALAAQSASTATYSIEDTVPETAYPTFPWTGCIAGEGVYIPEQNLTPQRHTYLNVTSHIERERRRSAATAVSVCAAVLPSPTKPYSSCRAALDTLEPKWLQKEPDHAVLGSGRRRHSAHLRRRPLTSPTPVAYASGPSS